MEIEYFRRDTENVSHEVQFSVQYFDFINVSDEKYQMSDFPYAVVNNYPTKNIQNILHINQNFAYFIILFYSLYYCGRHFK